MGSSVIPHTLVAIDPGAHAGVACFRSGILTRAWLDNIDRPGDPPFPIDVLAIEVPRIYPQRNQKGDPNDLITLAVDVGRWIERWHRYTSNVILRYHPQEWKKQEAKETTEIRVFDTLTVHERATLRSCLALVAPSYRHNVIDAVGIALFALKRGRRA